MMTATAQTFFLLILLVHNCIEMALNGMGTVVTSHGLLQDIAKSKTRTGVGGINGSDRQHNMNAFPYSYCLTLSLKLCFNPSCKHLQRASTSRETHPDMTDA